MDSQLKKSTEGKDQLRPLLNLLAANWKIQ